ncbi:PA2169 family four-helix-bundle protein [Mucilaginibacter koreensis]
MLLKNLTSTIMATTTENSQEVLSDLVKINNDRVDGFEKAIKDLSDENQDLKSVFEEYSQQSRKFSQELTAELGRLGGDAETSNSVSGTLHRAWIDVKALFGGSDRKSILEECERGEDAIKKAYRDALSPDSGLSAEYSSVVSQQASQINAAHDRIKALRDSQ